MYKKLLFLIAILSVFTWAGQIKADGDFEIFPATVQERLLPACKDPQLPQTTRYKCSDPNAEWNQDALPCTTSRGDMPVVDASPDFKCISNNQYQGSIYTHIIERRVTDCTTTQKCARLADCVALGGDCIKDVNVDTSMTCVRFHCPSENKTTCCYPNNTSTHINYTCEENTYRLGDRISCGGGDTFSLKCGTPYVVESYLYTSNASNFAFYNDTDGTTIPNAYFGATAYGSTSLGSKQFPYSPTKDVDISLRKVGGSGSVDVRPPSHVMIYQVGAQDLTKCDRPTPPPPDIPDTGTGTSIISCAANQYDLSDTQLVIPVKAGVTYTFTPSIQSDNPTGFVLTDGTYERVSLVDGQPSVYTPENDEELHLSKPSDASLESPSCLSMTEKTKPKPDPIETSTEITADDDCSSPEKPWNIDSFYHTVFETRFRCEWVDDAPCSGPGDCGSDRKAYTMIEPGNVTCECTGSAPSSIHHCRCVRPEDCESIGGICLSTSNDSEKINELLTKGYGQVLFRCPYGNDYTCYTLTQSTVTIPGAEIVPQLPETVVKTKRPRAALSLTLEGCCQQIVPPVAEGEEYQLNHFVQMGINIYECILCVIGSLMLMMIVVGGFFMLTSGGDASKVKKGQDFIKAAVIGGIIVFSSFLIVNFAIKALGADIISEERVIISPGQ